MARVMHDNNAAPPTEASLIRVVRRTVQKDRTFSPGTPGNHCSGSSVETAAFPTADNVKHSSRHSISKRLALVVPIKWALVARAVPLYGPWLESLEGFHRGVSDEVYQTRT